MTRLLSKLLWLLPVAPVLFVLAALQSCLNNDWSGFAAAWSELRRFWKS
jgi:hypothetical protein